MTSSDITFLTVEDMKMEPIDRQGRKRRASQASTMSNFSSMEKKLKKYEMDPTHDHTVRNARAAKANREKKKQEEGRLKEENRVFKQKVDELEKLVEDYKHQVAQLTKQLETQNWNQLKLQPSQEDHSIESALQAIMPALNAKYGLMEVGISEESSSFPNTTDTTDLPENTEQFDWSPGMEFLQDYSFEDFPPDFGEKDNAFSIPTDEIIPTLPPALPEEGYNLEPENGDPVLPSWPLQQPTFQPQTCHISLKDNHMVMVQRNPTMKCPSNLWPVLKSMALTPMGG